MKPRLKVTVVTKTFPQAVFIKSAIDQRLVGKPIVDGSTYAFIDGDTMFPNFTFNLRLQSSLDRDDVLNFLKDKLQNNQQIKDSVVSAEIEWHDCSHDDARIVDCKSNHQVWSQ